jgi:hypothetical protein
MMKKVLVENAIETVFDVFQVFTIVGDLWIGEKQGLLLHGDHTVGIVHIDVAYHQHDLVKIPPLVGKWL